MELLELLSTVDPTGTDDAFKVMTATGGAANVENANQYGSV